MQGEKVLIAGCGGIGQTLGERLASAGAQVYGLRRDVRGLPSFIQPVQADLTNSASLEGLGRHRFSAVVVTLSASEFTEGAYRRIYVEGLRNLLRSLERHLPERLLLASSTSVYHQQDGSWVDEETATLPDSFAGKIQLEAERMLAVHPIPSTVVRFGGIYGPGRTRLLQSLRRGEIVAAGFGSFSNRIHSDDCAGVLEHLLKLRLQGDSLQDCYLAVDSAPTPLRQVSEWLARQMGLALSDMKETARPTRGGNKRCSNRRLLESGYCFTYPDYQAGYRSLLADGPIEA